MEPKTVTLDVREDLRAGREPFHRIMDTVNRLRDGEQLRLLAPFEPHPLIDVLAMQGFAAATREVEDGFEVIFSLAADPAGDDSLL